MDCCVPTNREGTIKTSCPHCGQNGRRVPLVTLKSLLKPAALATLVPDRDYVFCPNPFCETVYFALDGSLAFFVGDLKVPVFQRIRTWMSPFVTVLTGRGNASCKRFGKAEIRFRKSRPMLRRGVAVVR